MNRNSSSSIGAAVNKSQRGQVSRRGGASSQPSASLSTSREEEKRPLISSSGPAATTSSGKGVVGGKHHHHHLLSPSVAPRSGQFLLPVFATAATARNLQNGGTHGNSPNGNSKNKENPKYRVNLPIRMLIILLLVFLAMPLLVFCYKEVHIVQEHRQAHAKQEPTVHIPTQQQQQQQQQQLDGLPVISTASEGAPNLNTNSNNKNVTQPIQTETSTETTAKETNLAPQPEIKTNQEGNQPNKPPANATQTSPAVKESSEIKENTSKDTLQSKEIPAEEEEEKSPEKQTRRLTSSDKSEREQVGYGVLLSSVYQKIDTLFHAQFTISQRIPLRMSESNIQQRQT